MLTNLSDPASRDQSGFNQSGTGITGSSGGAYRHLTATVPAGGATHVRLRYRTDGGVAENGILFDNLQFGANPLDGAEAADAGWTFDGFQRMTGTEVSYHFNAYVAENRRYLRNDTSLKSAYNFGFLNTKPDRVEHFPYQDGLLISYWDDSFTDNNVGDHPGGGQILPIDAHPSFHHSYDGHLLRPRVLSFDSTFGHKKTDAITINKDGQPTKIPSQKAVKEFDDRDKWWFDSDEHGATGSHLGRYQPGWNGVNVPKTGTQIRIKGESHGGEVSTSRSGRSTSSTPARRGRRPARAGPGCAGSGWSRTAGRTPAGSLRRGCRRWCRPRHAPVPGSGSSPPSPAQSSAAFLRCPHGSVLDHSSSAVQQKTLRPRGIRRVTREAGGA